VRLLVNCLRSVLDKTEYDNFEIVCCLDENRNLAETCRELEALNDQRVRVVRYRGTFNFARKINLGAANARGEHLVFLNDDVEVKTGDWLTAMLEFSQNAEIGAVGAKLYFPDGTIQHAGVVVPRKAPYHVLYRYPGKHLGYFGNAVSVCNYTAVTAACMMTRRSVFEEVGGFNEALPINFNDVDYCLKVRARGLRIVFTPYAELIHYESASRVKEVRAEDIAQLRAIWGDWLDHDPYYNPNFRQDTGDFLLAV